MSHAISYVTTDEGGTTTAEIPADILRALGVGTGERLYMYVHEGANKRLIAFHLDPKTQPSLLDLAMQTNK